MAYPKSKKERLPSTNEVLEDIRAKRVKPLYLFYGEEEFLIQECVNALIEALVPKEMQAFNVDVVDGDKIGAKDVVALAASYPMMNDRRLVVVNNFEGLTSSEKEREILSLYLNKPSETTCFVMVMDKKPDFRTKPFAELKRQNFVYEFLPLYDNQIPAWIESRCRLAGVKIEPDAIHILHSVVGNSLRAIQNELEKLTTYVGKQRTITSDDVSRVVGFIKGNTVFDLQNALGEGDGTNAMMILKRMLESGESPPGIIVMLTRYFFQLIKAKELRSHNVSEAEVAKALNVHQFFINGYLQAANRFSFSELEACVDKLRAADLQLKTSGGETNHIMEMLMYSLLYPQ
ncbi:MAG: DNA polymerase III subunit delta [Bacteroidetes bacterium]|nr:DNA polymerase III subunit delta [Bacteroidota bacterium]